MKEVFECVWGAIYVTTPNLDLWKDLRFHNGKKSKIIPWDGEILISFSLSLKQII